jgi:hypothetical protein
MRLVSSEYKLGDQTIILVIMVSMNGLKRIW